MAVFPTYRWTLDSWMPCRHGKPMLAVTNVALIATVCTVLRRSDQLEIILLIVQ